MSKLYDTWIILYLIKFLKGGIKSYRTKLLLKLINDVDIKFTYMHYIHHSQSDSASWGDKRRIWFSLPEGKHCYFQTTSEQRFLPKMLSLPKQCCKLVAYPFPIGNLRTEMKGTWREKHWAPDFRTWWETRKKVWGGGIWYTGRE